MSDQHNDSIREEIAEINMDAQHGFRRAFERLEPSRRVLIAALMFDDEVFGPGYFCDCVMKALRELQLIEIVLLFEEEEKQQRSDMTMKDLFASALTKVAFDDLVKKVMSSKKLTLNMLRPARYRRALGFPFSKRDVSYDLLNKELGRSILKLQINLAADHGVRRWEEYGKD